MESMHLPISYRPNSVNICVTPQILKEMILRYVYVNSDWAVGTKTNNARVLSFAFFFAFKVIEKNHLQHIKIILTCSYVATCKICTNIRIAISVDHLSAIWSGSAMFIFLPALSDMTPVVKRICENLRGYEERMHFQRKQFCQSVCSLATISLTRYQSLILENHKFDIHKDKIRNVHIDRHGPKINEV